jgi:hypothetical protein
MLTTKRRSRLIAHPNRNRYRNRNGNLFEPDTDSDFDPDEIHTLLTGQPVIRQTDYIFT